MAKISNFVTPDGTKYDIRSTAIPFGRVNSSSTATVFTATVPGITELTDGTCVMLDNGVVTSASGFTLNVNGLGAKPVYSNLAAATRDTTIFNINYTMLFVYDETRVSGGCWVCYRGYDSNTNTIGYQLRTNSGNLPMADTTARYRLYFTSADGTKWVPVNTSTSTGAATARTINTRPIDPWGPIVYDSTNGGTAAGSRPAVATLWQQYTLTIGYSVVKLLTAWKPVYMQCTPQTNGSAVMNDIVQALPTTADGKIYIFLGIAYSATAMELRVEHPVFYHDGTGLRIWTGRAIPTKTSELTNDSGFLTSAPVTSVNSKTGAVSLTASDVGALPSTTTIPTKTSDLTNDSGFITSVPVSSVNSKTGAVVLTASEVGALPDDTFIPTKTSDLINDSDFMSGMTILLYGHSTWQDFITAYTKKHVVYCRASSQSNPATGSQTRLAFMAYVNNADSPTEVEFQYYRSVSTHTASQQGDQVYVYKLTSAGTWTVTVREASVKVAAGTGITGTYSGGTMTLALDGTLPTKTSDLTNDSGFITGAQVPSNETDPTVPSWAKASTKPSYTASEVGALPSSTTIPTKTSQLTNDSGYITDAGVTSFNGSTGAVTYTAPVTSVNGQTGSVTVTEGLAPLIGTTDDILPSQVSSAIAEGRDVAISYTDGTFGELVFTAFNKAVTLNALVANTISFYNSTLYLFELDGALAYNMWLFTYRELAQIEDLADYVPTSRTINNKALSNNITLSASDVGALPSTTAIPTKTSDLTNDSGYITLADLPIYDGTVN